MIDKSTPASMKASDFSFDEMMGSAPLLPGPYRTLLSFVQVEDGLDELKAHWAGFSHSSDAYGFTFPNLLDASNYFCDVLSEFYVHQEFASHQMG